MGARSKIHSADGLGPRRRQAARGRRRIRSSPDEASGFGCARGAVLRTEIECDACLSGAAAAYEQAAADDSRRSGADAGAAAAANQSVNAFCSACRNIVLSWAPLTAYLR